MNNRLFDTQHNSSAQQRARIQTQRIHKDTQEVYKVSSDLSALMRSQVATTAIKRLETVEVQS